MNLGGTFSFTFHFLSLKPQIDVAGVTVWDGNSTSTLGTKAHDNNSGLLTTAFTRMEMIDTRWNGTTAKIGSIS
jgi:hypothetical protein